MSMEYIHVDLLIITQPPLGICYSVCYIMVTAVSLDVFYEAIYGVSHL